MLQELKAVTMRQVMVIFLTMGRVLEGGEGGALVHSQVKKGNMPWGGGGGGLPYINDGGTYRTRLVLLRALKSTMTTIRIIAVPFWY